jgi:ABC-2 type transport system permease protein
LSRFIKAEGAPGNNMNKYAVSFKISFVDSLTYKFNFFLTVLFALFPILIQLFIWNNVFAGGSALSNGADTVFGYSFNQIIYYAILANFINAVVTTNVHYQIGAQIKNGELNSFLIKPVNYVGFRLAGSFGAKILEIGILGLLLTAVILLGSLVFNLGIPSFSVIIFAILIFLAILLNFFLFLSISFLTFWITECTSFFMTFSIIITVLSGAVFPIDIFGEKFISISRVLPFQYMVYMPLNYVIGKIAREELLTAVTIQAAWVGGLFLVSLLLWKKGIKRYIAVGG